MTYIQVLGSYNMSPKLDTGVGSKGYVYINKITALLNILLTLSSGCYDYVSDFQLLKFI